METLNLLKQQHQQVADLFSQIENSQGEEEKSDLFAQLADAFLVHSHLEEEIFYPAVFADKTEEELREAVEEHLQAKRVIADMLEMDPSDEQWTAKCSVLHEDIQHHVDEEESQLFPMAQKEFGLKKLNELSDRMMERNDELMEEGEPRDLVFDETEGAVLPT